MDGYYENLKYLITEHFTGKYWIDGKPIYGIILSNSEIITGSTPTWGGLQTAILNLHIENCIKSMATHYSYGLRYLQFIPTDGFMSYYTGVVIGSRIILEYTKITI